MPAPNVSAQSPNSPEPSLWPPSFKAAIFDFDGTLAETWQIWQHVDEVFFAARGLEYSIEANRMLGVLGFGPGARWVIDEYGLDEKPEDICNEWQRMGREAYAREVELRPGAREYLVDLRGAGVKLALATTNDPQVMASMAPRVDVNSLFDAVVCGCEVARAKDHPDIYLEAARRLDVAPADCIVFEDIPTGIRSANSAGFATCGLRSTEPGQPVERIRELADLWLEGWGGLANR